MHFIDGLKTFCFQIFQKTQNRAYKLNFITRSILKANSLFQFDLIVKISIFFIISQF